MITVLELSQVLGLQVHQVEYLIRTRKIQPIKRAGISRLFDGSVVELLAAELAARHPAHKGATL